MPNLIPSDLPEPSEITPQCPSVPSSFEADFDAAIKHLIDLGIVIELQDERNNSLSEK